MRTMRNFMPALSAGFWLRTRSHETARQSSPGPAPRRVATGAGRRHSCGAAFSARQMSISSATSISSPIAFAPVTVKLLSCTPLPTSRAMPMRSQIKKSQTASTFSSNHGRRQNGMFLRCQAAQLTKNRMWRRFFVDDRFESLDQFRGKESGTLGGFEQPEREKAVDALAVACHHEGPFRIAAHRRIPARAQVQCHTPRPDWKARACGGPPRRR